MSNTELDYLKEQLSSAPMSAGNSSPPDLSQFKAYSWQPLDYISSVQSGLFFSTSFLTGIVTGLGFGFVRAMKHPVIKKNPALIWNQMLNSASRKSFTYGSSLAIFGLLAGVFHAYKANRDQVNSVGSVAFGTGAASTMMTLTQGHTRAALCGLVVAGITYTAGHFLKRRGYLESLST